MARKKRPNPTAARHAARVRHQYRHGGYSYSPGERPSRGRARGAREAARALREGERRGWHVEWEEDEYHPGNYGDNEDGTPYVPKEVLVAVLYDEDGEVLESLAGIADPTRDYGKTVEAELMMGALAHQGEDPRYPAMRGLARHGRY